ncbi:hypothetical protein [Caldibacillus debilis]|uniref:DUF4181 domain-containing protein n=1 Tax=Caldibacillus debilis TaxID=301148 RepID=A0A150M3P2_9BACI|nr:hypothetical protein [Caldibacillus debilis]KYD19214.1 hypothetical protein B4135_2138 [Caldibacillus debilis]
MELIVEKIKAFRYSFVHLLMTLLLFSRSFLDYENGIYVTLAFFLLINLTCFTSEYFLFRYYQKNKEKNSNKGYAIFISVQVFYTLLIFLLFKLVLFA